MPAARLYLRPAVLLLPVLLSACATVGDMLPSLPSLRSPPPPTAAQASLASGSKPAAQEGARAASPAASAAGPGAAAASKAPVPPEPAVPPAVQRAFDAARQALAANRLDEAERGLRALIQSNPDLPGPHANLGLLLLRRDKPLEAAAELEKAVSLNPAQPGYFNQLGIAYRQAGRFDKARAAYERAIAVDSAYPAAHLNLAILHDVYLWDGERALPLYERYAALVPSDERVKKWIADLRNRKPRTPAARKEQG